MPTREGDVGWIKAGGNFALSGLTSLFWGGGTTHPVGWGKAVRSNDNKECWLDRKLGTKMG